MEALVGYSKSDLVVPADDFGGDLAVANDAALAWCVEVNAVKHSETQAVPEQRLATERDVLRRLPSLRASTRRGVMRKVDKMSTVRIGSARYSVPHRLVGQTVEVSTVEDRIEIWHGDDAVASHRLVPPGGTSIADEHYDKPARKPRRAVRPRTDVERKFLALGEAAEAFLRAAAAAGTTRLPAHLAEITTLEPAHGRDRLVAALARAVEFRRFTADDVRSILAAGISAPKPVAAGQKLAAVLPLVPTRDLDAYRTADLKEVA